MSGIRVGLKISGEACPVVQESIENDSGVKKVNKMPLSQESGVVEEIIFDDDVDSSNEAFEELFSTNDLSIYQFNRGETGGCACDQIEKTIKHPISRVQVKDGSLYITLHLDEIDDLQSVVENLQGRFNSVSVSKIDHSDVTETEDSMKFDRERLTDRQKEVYSTAYEMGYFKHNNQSNASDIAEELDIAISTFSEHMNSIQKKMADAFFEDGKRR
jgi:predicted DNA binding protein